jgi:hypothetical protein
MPPSNSLEYLIKLGESIAMASYNYAFNNGRNREKYPLMCFFGGGEGFV